MEGATSNTSVPATTASDAANDDGGGGNSAYTLRPLPGNPIFGREIVGLDFTRPDTIPAPVVARLKGDLARHRLLLARGLGRLPAAAQLAVSRWWGPVESTFYRHPRSPHRDIFRVSNDEAEGCRGVGRSGWHIDGSFQRAPFVLQTMCFWRVAQGGDTLFSPLRELVESLPAETRALWERLSFVASGARQVHPLIYPHGATGLPTLCFHTGEPFCETFAVDFDPRTGRPAGGVLGGGETRALLRELSARLEDPARCYRHAWRAGDLALIDNCALGHFASAGTQRPAAEVGLRILHRTTVGGGVAPMRLKFGGGGGGAAATAGDDDDDND